VTCYANPVLKEWRDERLAEIQTAERVAREHIEGIALRAEHLPEPMRTEHISICVALKNLKAYFEKLQLPV